MSSPSSTLCIATRVPGTCASCRHANQGTVDFREGKVLCAFGGGLKRPDALCDVQRQLPNQVGGRCTGPYWLYERFSGENGTFGRLQHSRLLAEDAAPELRAALQAEQPLLEIPRRA